MNSIDLAPAASQSRTALWMQRGVVAALWISAIVVWQWYQSSNGSSTTETAQTFIDTVGGAWWGVLAFVLVYLARPIVLFPASILTIVGGILFGPFLGVAVVVIAANASAMVAYGVGRLLGRPPGSGSASIDDAEQRSLAQRWSTRMRERSFETVLVMRLLFLPYDLVNYLSGILRLRWLPFLLATALGSLPGTVSFVLLGASIDRVDEGLGGIDPSALGASIFVFVVSLGIAQFIRRRQSGPAAIAPAATAGAATTAEETT